METSNPLLKRADAFAQETTEFMTFDGALFKTAILLLVCTVSACFAWTAPAAAQLPLLLIGALGGLAMVLVTMFKTSLSPICAPAYAVLEGLALGVISSMMENAYHGIVLNAILLTFGVLALMLLLFTSRAIRVAPGFRGGVIACTGAIALVYVVDMVLRIFGVHVPFINETGAPLASPSA
jgi:uncharacterized YccA/Bax inhibitor family protein